jgi:predicted RNA binding protein YcfA (HicA-like mRNA interferase family)
LQQKGAYKAGDSHAPKILNVYSALPILKYMTHQKDTFYLNSEEPNKSCLLAMRSIILKLENNIVETTKYGMPCFCFKGKAFCYLWVDKKSKEPYFLMVEGEHLQHKALEKGNRSRMKILRVNPKKDLPIATINLIMNQALDVYRNTKN